MLTEMDSVVNRGSKNISAKKLVTYFLRFPSVQILDSVKELARMDDRSINSMFMKVILAGIGVIYDELKKKPKRTPHHAPVATEPKKSKPIAQRA